MSESQSRRGKPRPRTKPAEERRADLLDAAERVFVERGIAAARLDEITRRAEVAIGTLYLYFQSKDDLIVALRARYIERLVAQQEAAVAALPADDWPGRLDSWMTEAVRSYVDHAELHDILYDHTSENAKTTVQTGLGPENQQIESLRRLIAQRPDPPPGTPTPEVAANLVYSAFYGATHALLHHQESDLDRRADELIAQLTDLARSYLRVGDTRDA